MTWEIGFDHTVDSERIVSADVYVSRDGDAFEKKQTVTTGEIQLDFADVKDHAMYRICAVYADGSKKISDIITLEKVLEEDAIEDTEEALTDRFGSEEVSMIKAKEIGLGCRSILV